MKIELIGKGHELWERVQEYAQQCSWTAGKSLVHDMKHRNFQSWERILVLLDHERIAGYCSILDSDCIPDLPYSPYIGYLFVDEAYRGRRLSEYMINSAMDYLKKTGFTEVYLCSDHIGLYEKYGFFVVATAMAPWGKEQKIYQHHIQKYNEKCIKLIENELTTSEFKELSTAVEFSEISMTQIEKALKNSLFTIKAVDEEKTVGMGRVVGDGAICWFIQEVCVLPEYQGMGIGKEIVNRLVELVKESVAPGTKVTIQLMAAHGKEKFYQKLGFISRPNEYSGPGMQMRFII